MPLSPLQPSGTAAYRGAAARRLTGCMQWLARGFDLLGAEPVIPASLVSYLDAGGWLNMADDERIRFIDRRSGDVISLRADLTTQVLDLANPSHPGFFWAQGPVYRDSHPATNTRREKYQATFEVLYNDPRFAINYSLLAACWLAARALRSQWTLVVGHTQELEPLREQTGHYVAPARDNWPDSWAALPGQSLPECLTFVQTSGIAIPVLRRNRTLPPARSYYEGWFFRIYAPGCVEPLFSGGQYRDPRTADILHAGFGVDIEHLAERATLDTADAEADKAARTLQRQQSDVSQTCVQLWDQGVRTQFEA